MTEAEETRDTLRRHVEGHDETLNHLADAVAIFGPSKRLAYHNTAFQQLFGIDRRGWTTARPTPNCWIACASAASCRSGTTIRLGRRTSWSSTGPPKPRRTTAGPCPTGGPCGWSASRIRWAGCCCCSRTSPASWTCAAATTPRSRCSAPPSTS
ncbi:hypothetical protein [Brevundimonas denitrificans]|uniref:hypothetical protein n=1 Tax=Brevundimonas denitrificans TaxID=1443434 RepID=UPI00223AC793|nr:hypothetical protein [Brevundimonas denitrificans]